MSIQNDLQGRVSLLFACKMVTSLGTFVHSSFFFLRYSHEIKIFIFKLANCMVYCPGPQLIHLIVNNQVCVSWLDAVMFCPLRVQNIPPLPHPAWCPGRTTGGRFWSKISEEENRLPRTTKDHPSYGPQGTTAFLEIVRFVSYTGLL